MDVENVGTFLDCLQRSGLIPQNQLHLLLNVARGILPETELLPESDATELARYLVQSGAITKWQARQLIHGCSRGFFLGRFRLLGLLGRGGMSVVYLADEPSRTPSQTNPGGPAERAPREERRGQDRRDGCVALKVLLPDRSGHSSLSERFRLEANALCELSRLGHPNIVRAYSLEYGRQGGGCEGDSVTRRYEKRRLSDQNLRRPAERNPKSNSEREIEANPQTNAKGNPEMVPEENRNFGASSDRNSDRNTDQKLGRQFDWEPDRTANPSKGTDSVGNSLEELERITDLDTLPSDGVVRSSDLTSGLSGNVGTSELTSGSELVCARTETAFLYENDARTASPPRRALRTEHTVGDDGYWFLVLEYIRGQSLAAMIRENGPLPISVAADYLRQAAEGLSVVHESGYVHRDIKPGNLMVEYTGCVRLLDMGLARQGEETPDGLTPRHADRLFGTADYLSPEQVRNSHIASVESDIYSLGCTFYAMLTGQPPFPAKLVADKLDHQLHTPAPDLRLLRPEVPAELAQLALRMVAKKPYQRPSSAREVAAALTAWLHGKKAASPPRFIAPTRPYAIELPRAIAVPVAEPFSPETETAPPDKPSLSEDQIAELLAGVSVAEESELEPPLDVPLVDGWEEEPLVIPYDDPSEPWEEY